MEQQKKYTITFTRQEVQTLAFATRHLSDYVCGDDRTDHGLAMLKKYRDVYERQDRPEYIRSLFTATVKLNRKDYKIQGLI